ncbi:alcohol dehydrogenase [NADP(+)]-like [Mizuhopecten yessoensis]|uniref:alcohol dehydrogenase [NADP(+)]-like n=1 Tax=Mizuhopecten yessoensis TaxID=6573 RepID=UPI000B45919C|nr:alcohol dehydrogenase [NADP(+)]-like [Mizuhopecten yessoensis]
MYIYPLKLGSIYTRPSDVAFSMSESLRKLRMSYVDLFLIHTPMAFKKPEDPNNVFPVKDGRLDTEQKVDIEGVWKEMEKLVDQGKTKSIGISNLNAAQLERIRKVARIMPVTNQLAPIERHKFYKASFDFEYQLNAAQCLYIRNGCFLNQEIIWKSFKRFGIYKENENNRKRIGTSHTINLVDVCRLSFDTCMCFINLGFVYILLPVECHAYFPRTELEEYLKKYNMPIMSYGPIGSPGRLAFKSVDIDNESDVPVLLKDPAIAKLATKYSKTPTQILLRNLLQRNIIVIPKSVTPSRIQENGNVFDFQLTSEDMDTIAGIDKGLRLFKAEIMAHLDDYPFNSLV